MECESKATLINLGNILTEIEINGKNVRSSATNTAYKKLICVNEIAVEKRDPAVVCVITQNRTFYALIFGLENTNSVALERVLACFNKVPLRFWYKKLSSPCKLSILRWHGELFLYSQNLATAERLICSHWLVYRLPYLCAFLTEFMFAFEVAFKLRECDDG